jgi:rhodanese-related sulfurtransferase
MSTMNPLELSAEETARRRAAGASELVLLDVREPEELAICRIEGAEHIPMGDIPSRLQHLDPERDLVVFCHHGVRSARVALWLRGQGFERVWSLAGGIDAWAQTVDPTLPRY